MRCSNQPSQRSFGDRFSTGCDPEGKRAHDVTDVRASLAKCHLAGLGLIATEDNMLKTMLWSVAIGTTSVLMSVGVARADPLYINAVDIDVVPGQIENYLAAIKEVGAATIKSEPGCSEFDITVSQKDPNHLFIFEVYDNAAVFDAHLKSDHYKKYAATAKDAVAKREVYPLSSVAMMNK
jgi:(4S)-4-hydroxy-5-phosphonooxypentane-2,3-dione isomerase